MNQLHALTYGPAAQHTVGTNSILVFDSDSVPGEVVCQFYDNHLDGKNRVFQFAQQFVEANGSAALLRRVVDEWSIFEDDDEAVSGADLVDWFAQFRQAVKEHFTQSALSVAQAQTDAGLQTLQATGDTEADSVLPSPMANRRSTTVEAAPAL